MNGFETAAAILPEELSAQLRQILPSAADEIEEVRLRASGAFSVKLNGEEYLVNRGGGLSRTGSDIRVTVRDIETVLDKALKSSLYSYRKDLASGFLTLPGGCRLGVSGTGAEDPRSPGRISSVRQMTSVNIRIPREVKGCAERLFRTIEQEGCNGLLLAGPPGSGKTTFLRDFARCMGSLRTTAVIDERCELGGEGCFFLGQFTDVFSAYGRFDGIMCAIRSMSPQAIVVDEIGSAEDVGAIEYAVNSGVSMTASCHCGSLDELERKENIRKLLEWGVFECCAFINNKRITEVRRLV